mgnify:CR=1 FL=1
MRANLEQAENCARDIGRIIKKSMPEGWGFSLVLFSFGEDGLMTYLSSGQREDCIKMLEELLTKIKSNERNV